MEHSKLPWKVLNSDDNSTYETEHPDCLSIESQDEWNIARIWLHPLGYLPQAKVNAAFIVTACNAHDTLKAKLDAATDALREIKIIACQSDYLSHEDTCKLYNFALDAHNAILSKAKEIK